ncbi:MAG: cytochrome c [Verrucomicrobiales bacterium]|nr:cytochrome c [Verrucomicrobiales bacterium]
MKYYPIFAIAAGTLLIGCSDSKTESNAIATAEPEAADHQPAISHPLPGDPEAGKEVYLRACSACHQPDGSGLNGMLAANFVSDKTRLAKPNEVLLNSIRNGVVAENKIMPPHKDILSDSEIKNALSYIRKTFGSSE